MSSTTLQIPILQGVLNRIDDAQQQKLINEISRGSRVIFISGLVSEPARALVLTSLQRATGKLFAIVTHANQDLEKWERDLRFWYCAVNGARAADDKVLLMPASESDPYAGSSPHAETLEQRALTLWRITSGKPDFVVLTARALARKTVAPQVIQRTGTILKRDEDHSPEALVEKLIASGYVREDPVGDVGEFSIRGGILDVWSPGHNSPVRIEFFGDTVDSIREFDPETQLSTTQMTVAEIAPMRELSVTNSDFRLWAEFARERWSDSRFARSLLDRTKFADEGESFSGWEWLMPLVIERNSSLFDYLKDTVFVIDEPAGIENYLADAYQTLADRYAETDAADDLGLAPDELYLSPESLRERLDAVQRLELRTLGRTAAQTDQALALDAEHPQVQIGRSKAPRR